MDGGLLLHKVVWPKDSPTISTICQCYVAYVLKHYGGNGCTVVFDGYSAALSSTKRAEQSRRYKTKRSVDIHFGEKTVVTVKQDDFLSNEKNKSRLISFLITALTSHGVETEQASSDADTLIVRTAIMKSFTCDKVAIVGEDVDLIVLLMALTPTEQNILFVKPSRGKVARKVYSSQQLQTLGMKDSILLVHAFSGCDTTSAAYRKGKLSCFKLFKKQAALQAIDDIFNSPSSSREAVAAAGNKIFLALYNAPRKQTSLNMHRYNAFTKSVSNAKPDLSALPPTEGAARQHAFRVYHQIQFWLGNELPPV